MIKFLILTLAILSTPNTGFLSAYAELPTVATVEYRQEIGDLPHDISKYDVLIAVADCGLIGKEGVLHTIVGSLKAIVFDCAGNDGTPSWMEENNIVAEIDYWTWQKYPELVGTPATFETYHDTKKQKAT